MADKQTAASELLKEIHAEIAKRRQAAAELSKERLEVMRQLKLGATQDVRKPGRLRRQIAAELTRLSQLELRLAWAEKGLQADGRFVGRRSWLTAIEEGAKED